jgi:purine-binding chemotaxis protein CheW
VSAPVSVPVSVPVNGSVNASIVQFCTFTLDGLRFGIPVDRVQEVVRHLRSTRVPLAAPVIRGLMNLRGQIVTAIDLRRRLEFPDREAGLVPMNVVIRMEDGPVSLLVDQIDDVVIVDSATRDDPPPTLKGTARELIRGAYQLPNRLLLELDLDRTLALEAARFQVTRSLSEDGRLDRIPAR